MKNDYDYQNRLGRAINDDRLIVFYGKYGFICGYEIDKRNRLSPQVEDTNTGEVFVQRKIVTKDRRLCLYNCFAYCNYKLLEKGIITEEQKTELDNLIHKYLNNHLCYS